MLFSLFNGLNWRARGAVIMNFEKKWFKINGGNKMVIINPAKDTIADVVRRIGLTGTKIGCGAGQCGACSMIVNGELVRGCVRKATRIPDYSEIITIEGIGTPENLHPLQLAWITYGGVQCGFCTPGFIVSAYALLQKNPSPTRQDVRDWFTKNHNLCRCTGYKPLVDAVMEAAAVMRGEKQVEDITFHLKTDSMIGTKYPKPTALEKVTGVCDFGNDIELKMPEGTLHLALVMPEAHHANILNIDTSEAEAYPGVVRVITGKDAIGVNKSDQGAPNHGYVSPAWSGFTRPILSDKKICRYGDVVAVVAAYTEEAARAAAKLVKVTLEELPAYKTVLESFQPGAVKILGEDGPENLYDAFRISKGEDTRKIFDTAEHFVEGSFYSTRQPHLTIEPDVLQAYIDTDGRLTIHNKSQCVYAQKNGVAQSLGLDPDKVRIIENPTGGSFGYSMSPNPSALVGMCALLLDAPVTMTLKYPEHQLMTGKRSASYTNARLSCDDDGKLVAYEFDSTFDTGAYNEQTMKLLFKACHFYGYPYNIPNIMGICKSGFSNNAVAVTFRGFGMPQVYTSGEAIIDMLAEKMKMDPFEFRYKNLLAPGDTICTNAEMDEYPMREMFDMIRPYYLEAKKRAEELSTDTIKRGVGVSCGGYSCSAQGDACEDAIELNEDGSVTVYNTYEQVGQGADIGTLTIAHEALRPLGIRPEQVKMVQNDSAICPDSNAAAGSKQWYLNGFAIKIAADKLIDAMRKDDGTYRTYEEMKAEGIPTKYFGKHVVTNKTHYVDSLLGVGRNMPEFNYNVYVTEVAVDVTTGKVKVLATKCVADFGQPGNLLAVEGQFYGGFEHCVGFALSENYSPYEKKYSTMIGCGFPACNDTPDKMDLEYHIVPRKETVFGGAGTAENFQSDGHMSIINAINNAVGVRVYELPATPDKILAGLKAKSEGKEIKPEKYDCGIDFYDLYDRMTAMAKELEAKGGPTGH